MSLTDSLPQAVLLAVLLYVSWFIVKPYVVRSPLDKLPGPPRLSAYSGNLKAFFARDCWDYRTEIARKYGRVSLFPGMLGRKWIHVYDPKALHSVLIKELDIYEEPVIALRILLGPGLLSVLGNQHKRQRKMLNPVFSAKHLREMTPLFFEIIHKASPKDGVELDMLGWMGRTTLEVLGQAGLGYSFDPLTEDRMDEFANAVKDFFPQFAKSVITRLLLPYVTKIGSASFRRRIVEILPMNTAQELRKISDTMHERSVRIFKEKKAALEKGDEALKHQIGEGRDIMSILLRANMAASEEDRLPDDELIGQVSTMILAGMDTTANSLARVLQLLSENPDIQEKLREEIVTTAEAEGHDGTIDFDRLMELPYLEAICRETLRVYPGVASLMRDTTQDTVMPLFEPIRLNDGTTVSAIPVPKNTRIVMNINAANRDPTLWGPDADVWRPSRWLEPLPRAVEEAHVPGVYSHLMTFIGGSRACIGFKFAQVEMKAVLFVLLQHFKFEPTGKPIAWNFAAVQYPTVGKESPVPELPLKVTALHA
ncbi:cytochrome P450 [Lentinus tigrinus ALCF2SS1-7]|uniref:cytochrome P450 n=1 Tax=Lentinus tigrinus ALCF2SS1-7 TaxID=1328758 RepID=UPI0011661C42|nr:cytochrome P450 [Lentinus tigrinus ALCF2SS1-7]